MDTQEEIKVPEYPGFKVKTTPTFVIEHQICTKDGTTTIRKARSPPEGTATNRRDSRPPQSEDIITTGRASKDVRTAGSAPSDGIVGHVCESTRTPEIKLNSSMLGLRSSNMESGVETVHQHPVSCTPYILRKDNMSDPTNA
ncbi:hypothetical protein LWI28_004696 [Acer negundo]|uniref:Uncharacterized protein n=1 Tax=Acer negundo TaxID=4023 RepID=A0AAD5ISP1_ACENE|nr:hypothetical protein LWI28_004696 [Acer negundo]